MSKDRRLGRGLAALLSNDDASPATLQAAPVATGQPRKTPPRPSIPTAAPKKSARSDIDSAAGREALLSVHLIEENPFQPRREFGASEIESLAESLKEHDMLQPVLVRHMGANKYQLISGERRLRAARSAGWKKIPARIREADDRLVAELAIVENLQRKDLNPIEKAFSFQRYLEEHDCTQEDLGQRLKIDRSTIANLLRLLELPHEVQRALQQGAITAGHARALLPLGDRKEQIDFCKRIGNEGLSVRATEQLVSESIGRESPTAGTNLQARRKDSKRIRSSQIASLEQEFRRALGTKTDIKTTSGGRGKIVIHFKNADEFERIQQILVDDTPAVAPKRRRTRA